MIHHPCIGSGVWGKQVSSWHRVCQYQVPGALVGHVCSYPNQSLYLICLVALGSKDGKCSLLCASPRFLFRRHLIPRLPRPPWDTRRQDVHLHVHAPHNVMPFRIPTEIPSSTSFSRSALMATHRKPLSYLTLLDVNLIINLGFATFCIFVVIASEVAACLFFIWQLVTS